MKATAMSKVVQQMFYKRIALSIASKKLLKQFCNTSSAKSVTEDRTALVRISKIITFVQLLFFLIIFAVFDHKLEFIISCIVLVSKIGAHLLHEA